MENKEEEIDMTIKQRLEISKLQDRQREAMKELDGVIEKIEKKNSDLRALKDSQEGLLKEIEEEAGQRVEMAMKKLTAAGEAAGELEEKAALTLQETRESTKRVQDTIIGLLGRIKVLIDKSDNLKMRSEGIMDVVTKAQKDLEEKTITNSEFEKVLLGREKEVDIKSKKADQKLKEAKDIAYWHKKPGAEYQGE